MFICHSCNYIFTHPVRLFGTSAFCSNCHNSNFKKIENEERPMKDGKVKWKIKFQKNT